MKQRDAMGRSQLGQCGFQLDRFVDGFTHEELDDILSPGLKRAAVKSAGKTLYSCKPDTLDLVGFPIKQSDTCLLQNVTHLVLPAGFEVVIPQDADDRNLHGIGEVSGKLFRFFGKSGIGEVAQEEKNIYRRGDLGKSGLKGILGTSVMNVTDRS